MYSHTAISFRENNTSNYVHLYIYLNYQRPVFNAPWQYDDIHIRDRDIFHLAGKTTGLYNVLTWPQTKLIVRKWSLLYFQMRSWHA